MDFELTPQQEALRRDVVAFGRSVEIADRADAPAESFPMQLWRQCADFGIHGLPFPREFGGGGHDGMTVVIALEALGSSLRDNGLLFALAAQMSSVQMPLARFGSQDQRRRYLEPLCRGAIIAAHAMTEPDAGSDAFALSTRAKRRGTSYFISGSKIFVSQAPVADVFLVFATVHADASVLGITAFLVDRHTDGVHIGAAISKAGLQSAPMASVTFDNVEVVESNRLGREGRGALVFLDAMEWERILIMATGIGSLERQFKDLLASRQNRAIDVAGSNALLVDLRVRLETARLILYRAAWAKVRDEQSSLYSSMAKLVVSDAMLQGAIDAVNLGGMASCICGGDAERDLRDALAAPIYSGTANIQRRNIARALGLRVD